MELEFELDDYVDIEHREFGATLVFEAHLIKEVDRGEVFGAPYSEVLTTLHIEETATLFTYDQDGGNRRELEVDPLDYLTEDEIIERLQNEN